MMRTQTYLTLTAVLGAGLLGTAATAQAATVNQVFRQLATDSGQAGTQAQYNLNDEDQSIVIDSNSNGLFDAGDIVRGTFNISSVSTKSGAQTFDGALGVDSSGADSGNNALFGRFSAQVESATPFSGAGGSGVNIQFTYDNSGNADSIGVSNNTMFEFYEGADFNNVDTTTGQAGFDNVPGQGSLYAAAGMSQNSGDTTPAANASYAFNTSDSFFNDATALTSPGGSAITISELRQYNDGSIANASDISLDFLNDLATGVGVNDSSTFASLGTFNDGLEIDGTSGTGIIGSTVGNSTSDPTDDQLGSQATFRLKATVIPTPSSALMGGGMLLAAGLGLGMRRRRAMIA